MPGTGGRPKKALSEKVSSDNYRYKTFKVIPAPATHDESMKAVLFLLNSRCNVSMEKTAQFILDVTDGAMSPCVGMINGLFREFSLKSKKEQDSLFKALLDAPVMHVDGTAARINGNHVFCKGKQGF